MLHLHNYNSYKAPNVKAGSERGTVLDDAGNHKFARGSRPVPF